MGDFRKENKTKSSMDAIYCCPVAFTLFRWNVTDLFGLIDVIC